MFLTEEILEKRVETDEEWAVLTDAAWQWRQGKKSWTKAYITPWNAGSEMPLVARCNARITVGQWLPHSMQCDECGNWIERQVINKINFLIENA